MVGVPPELHENTPLSMQRNSFIVLQVIVREQIGTLKGGSFQFGSTVNKNTLYGKPW